MALRRQKSRKQQVAELAADYLKVKAVTKTAKGAKKAAKGTAVYKVAKKTPVVKRLPVIAGAAAAAAAAAVATKAITSRRGARGRRAPHKGAPAPPGGAAPRLTRRNSAISGAGPTRSRRPSRRGRTGV